MATIENFLLLCGIQTFIISVALLTGVVLSRCLTRRRSTTFVSAGLASLILLWLVACLPFDGWITPQRWGDATATRLNVTGENGTINDVSLLTPNPDKELPTQVSSDTATASAESTFAKVTSLALQQMQELSQPVETESSSFVWKRVLVWLALAAIGIGLVRLVIAFVTICKLSRTSRELFDEDAMNLLNAVEQRLNCKRRVKLFETGETQAAFTIGWLQPKICLSENWRTWESQELEATLAHEVAHINSGDFLQRVVAQLSAALNFYNPIVHYLCGQLCIDQEFNADARAAEVVGGKKNYLNTLASLALQNDYSNHRLAPMFLPTRKSFFRRIEMLRSKQASRMETPLARYFSLLVVGLIVASVAGFRFPDSSNVEIVESSRPVEDRPANLHYVAGDSDAVLILRPARLLEKDLVRDAFDAFQGEDEQNQLNELLTDMFGVSAKSIDQLTLVVSDLAARDPIVLWTAQLRDKGWWTEGDIDKQMREHLAAIPEKSFRGKKFYLSESPVVPATYYVANERTMICIIGSRNRGEKMIRTLRAAVRTAEGPSGSWPSAWDSVADSDVSCVVLNDAIEVFQQDMTGQQDVFGPLLQPVLESADFMVASLNHSNERTDIEATIHCAEGSEIETTKEAIIGIKAFAKTLLRTTKKKMNAAGDRPTGNKLAEKVLDLPLALLDDVTINSESNQIVIKSQLTENHKKLLQPLIPAIITTRAAAVRVESMNNLRQLTLGMHNYHSAYNHFPPPVLTSDQGKKYSWRIAILPFVEGQHIYDQYRFDEDWNSEHNQKVTSQVPRIFQHAIEKKAGSNRTSYFMITGPKTPFFGSEGTRIRDIRDGTSNTICLVEAKHDVHWAQPSDIQFADGELATELGGYHDDGFNLTMCDGSARFVSKDIDPEVLKLLIMGSDGQPVDHSRLK